VFFGVPMREMTPEAQILHLCVHAFHHRFAIGLRAICDITETLRHYQETLDWGLLCQYVHQWGAEGCVYVNLWLAKELLHAPVPGDLLQVIEPRYLGHRYMTLIKEQVLGASSAEEAWEERPSASFRVQLIMDIRLQFDSFWRYIIPPRLLIGMLYRKPPNSLQIFLYYPKWLKDLLQSYLSAMSAKLVLRYCFGWIIRVIHLAKNNLVCL
jgi:hypothetical protein